MAETGRERIHKLEVTEDCLTSRGGLVFFAKYVQNIGVVSLLLSKFAGLKKTVKGVSVEKPALPGAVLLFGRHQPPRELFR